MRVILPACSYNGRRHHARPSPSEKAGMTQTPLLTLLPQEPGHGRAAARRAIPALAVVLALAGCGGGGGGGSTPTTTGGGSGGSSTPAYFLSGPAGVDHGQGLTLAGVNASTATTISIPSASLFSSTLPSEIATLSQWTVSGSTASGVGTRLRVWAGTDNNLYSTDLKAGSGISAPSTTQLSNLSVANVCPSAPTVLEDFANPANSALVFRDYASGCGGTLDQFDIVPLTAIASTSPAGPSLNEPVDVARNASGAITKVVWIMHSPSLPSTPSTIGVSGSINAAPTGLGSLGGNGLNLNTPSGDFASLAVVAQADGSYVWVYRDTNQIMAVNLNGSSAPVAVFAAADQDVVQLPVVVDGTNVFVAMTDDHNPVDPNATPLEYTCQIVRIPTAGSLTTSSGVVALYENTTGSGSISAGSLPIGLRLVGKAGGYLIYFNNGVYNGGASGSVLLEAVAESATGATASTPIASESATAATAFSVTSLPIPVANGVYYNVINTSSATNPAQTYFYKFSGGTTAAVGGANGSLLLGGVLASPAAATPATPTYDSVILAEPAANASLSGATIIGFNNSGFNGAVLGTLPTLKTDSYQGVTLSEGPLQAGVAALVEVSGTQNNGNNDAATDLFVITPASGSSLKRVTSNLQ